MEADVYSSLEAIAAKVDMLEVLRDIEPIWVDNNGTPRVCDAYARRFCYKVRNILYNMCSYCDANPTDNVFTANELSEIENSINTIACKFNDAGGLADVHGRASWLEVSLQEASKYLNILVAIIEKNARNHSARIENNTVKPQEIGTEQPEAPKRKAGRPLTDYDSRVNPRYKTHDLLQKRIEKDLEAAAMNGDVVEAYCIMCAAIEIGVYMKRNGPKRNGMTFAAIRKRFKLPGSPKPEEKPNDYKYDHYVPRIKELIAKYQPDKLGNK